MGRPVRLRRSDLRRIRGALGYGRGKSATANGFRSSLEKEWWMVLLARSSGYQREFDAVAYEAVTFKIGDRLRYTPDFVAWRPDGSMVAFEVKGGFFREDSRAKLLAAAQVFSRVTWVLVRKGKAGWSEEVIRPGTIMMEVPHGGEEQESKLQGDQAADA
jgi:hypothetical protein